MCHTFISPLPSFIKTWVPYDRREALRHWMESEGKLWKPLRLQGTVRSLTGQITGGTKVSELWVLTFKLSWTTFTFKGKFRSFEGVLGGKAVFTFEWPQLGAKGLQSQQMTEYGKVCEDIDFKESFRKQSLDVRLRLTFGYNHIEDANHSWANSEHKIGCGSAKSFTCKIGNHVGSQRFPVGVLLCWYGPLHLLFILTFIYKHYYYHYYFIT